MSSRETPLQVAAPFLQQLGAAIYWAAINDTRLTLQTGCPSETARDGGSSFRTDHEVRGIPKARWSIIETQEYK